VTDDVDFDAMMDDLAETLMGGEVWYARALDQYGTLRGGWFTMDETIMTMAETSITMGDERLVNGIVQGYPSVPPEPETFDGGAPAQVRQDLVIEGGTP
jgi:hypothetical protein